MKNEVALESPSTNQYGEHYFYSINRHTFDKTDSTSVFRAHYKESLFKENHLYIIVGSDSGLLFRHIVNEGIPEGARYIFVEPVSIHQRLTKLIFDISEYPEIVFCSPEQWEEKSREYQFIEYTYGNAVSLIKSLAVIEGSLIEYLDLWRSIDRAYNLKIWGICANLGSALFFQCQIENLAENHRSSAILKKLGHERVAVILGGGPSLDEILPWVKTNRENVVVISVSRIAQRLNDIDLVPDFYVIIDPNELSFDVSKSALKYWENIILLNANHANPLFLGQWPGRALYLDKRFPWDSDYEDDVINAAGPTVTNSAISVAIEMRFHKIILAGVDLCFSQEGYSHAKGSNEQKAGPLLGWNSQTVVTNSGLEAETENSLYNAIKSIEDQAKIALDNGCQIINPAPGAVAMKNVAHIPLDNIKIPLHKTKFQSLLARALPADSNVSKLDHYHFALKELDIADNQLERMYSLCSDALECNKALFNRDTLSRNHNHKETLDEIEERLIKEFGTLSHLIKFFGSEKFIQILRPVDIEKMTYSEAEKLGDTYYKACQFGIEKLRGHIKNGVNRLRSRISEHEITPDIKALAAQWRLDKTPGRYIVWKIQHPDVYTTQDDKNILTSLEVEFNAILSKTDTPHMQRSREWASLNGVKGKAQELFTNMNRSGLMRLINGLEAKTEPDAKPLLHLAKGYLYELEKQYNEAIDEFLQVEKSELLDNSLERVSIIALEIGNIDIALAALTELAKLTPIYKPKLAELHRISGNIKTALDIYTEYLSEFQDDYHTMTILGMLYKDIGNIDAAIWIFEHLSKQNINNKTITNILESLKAGRQSL